MQKEYPAKFCQYLITQDLVHIFPEIYKLAQLIITIPATSLSIEISLSTLKRIKRYLRNTQGQENDLSLPTKHRNAPPLRMTSLTSSLGKNRRTDPIYKK